MKIETKDQYKERFRRRGVKRAKKVRLSDTATNGHLRQPKWDGSARVERSSWQPNDVGEQPSWIRRIGL